MIDNTEAARIVLLALLHTINERRGELLIARDEADRRSYHVESERLDAARDELEWVRRLIEEQLPRNPEEA